MISHNLLTVPLTRVDVILVCLGAKFSCKSPWTRNKVVSKGSALVSNDKSGSSEPMVVEGYRVLKEAR